MATKSDNSGCLLAFGAIAIFISLGLFSEKSTGGGFLFLIGGALIIWFVINSGESETKKEIASWGGTNQPANNPPQVNTHGLQLKISTELQNIEGVPFNILQFHSKGMFSSTRRIQRPCFEVRMTDVTDAHASGGEAVLCLIDDLQSEDSTEFRFRQVLPRPLEAGTGSFDWVKFASVPKELLVFPKTGNRKIKAVLRVSDAANQMLIASADVAWSTTVDGVGYLEMDDEESEAKAASLKLAMCIAAADGSVDDDEVCVIKEWGEKTVNALPAPRRAERLRILNEALQDATREIRANNMPMLEADAIHCLRDKNEPRFLYEAYELCLQVLKADGEAHPEEMAQLTRLARQLDLDETKVRILTDRHLADVEFAPVGHESEDDHILGITGDMSKDEIRKHLNKLYQKHQARTQNDNPDVIAKAKEWLDRIARARVRHLG